MPITSVLVDAELNKVKSILEKIREIERVAEAYSVAGEGDIVVKARAESFQEVAGTVTKEIHKIDGIEDTVTLFAFD